MVCISYLDGSSPAHIRYTIRRLRRKLPHAQILLGCWLTDRDITSLRETVKVDVILTTLREALMHCMEAAVIPDKDRQMKITKIRDEAVSAA